MTRKRIINFSIFFPQIIIEYFLSKYLVKVVQNGLWLTGDSEELVNSTESVIVSLIENVKSLFTYDGLRHYFFQMVGQLYAMTVVTYGIFVIACVAAAVVARRFWRKKELCNCDNAHLNELIVFSFGMIGLLSTSMLSSLNALQFSQQQWSEGIVSKFFLYSRYWSIYITVLMMLGGYFLYKYREAGHQILTVSLVVILVIVFVFNGCMGFRYNGQPNLVSGVYYPFTAIGFWDVDGVMTDVTYFRISLIILAVFAVFYICFVKDKLTLGYCVICCVMFANYGYGTYHISIKTSDALYEQFSEMIEIVEAAEYDSEYIYTSEEFALYKLWIQYLFPRYKLTYGLGEEENAIVITDQISDELLGDEWRVVYDYDEPKCFVQNIYLLVRGDELIERLADLGYDVREVELLIENN